MATQKYNKSEIMKGMKVNYKAGTCSSREEMDIESRQSVHLAEHMVDGKRGVLIGNEQTPVGLMSLASHLPIYEPASFRSCTPTQFFVRSLIPLLFPYNFIFRIIPLFALKYYHRSSHCNKTLSLIRNDLQ